MENLIITRETATQWWWAQSQEHFVVTCYDSPNCDKTGYRGPFKSEMEAIADYVEWMAEKGKPHAFGCPECGKKGVDHPGWCPRCNPDAFMR